MRVRGHDVLGGTFKVLGEETFRGGGGAEYTKAPARWGSGNLFNGTKT